ncbi:MAG: hypothetical protein SPI59_03860 [Finegoldia sp.]|nr:hypothetical protein [Finegoldia sp.]
MKKKNFIILGTIIGLILVIGIFSGKRPDDQLNIIIYNDTEEKIENLFLKSSSDSKMIPVDRIKKNRKEKINLTLNEENKKSSLSLYYSDRKGNEHREFISDDLGSLIDKELSIYIQAISQDGALDIKIEKASK